MALETRFERRLLPLEHPFMIARGTTTEGILGRIGNGRGRGVTPRPADGFRSPPPAVNVI